MTNQNQYISEYYLQCLLKNQQNVPHKYNTKDYFGGCARCIEQESANFLQNFIDDNFIINPEHYELLDSILFIMSRSGYSPIKKLLKRAHKKYNELIIAEQERIKERERIQNLKSFSILSNKKKMHAMSSADMCILGAYIENTTDISTNRIKDKFNGFARYRIDMVLSGNRAPDAGFDDLVQKYATSLQHNRYYHMANHSTQQTISTEPEQEQKQDKKSKGGFFNKIRNAAKSAFNAVKKPALVIGFLGAAVFGGKKLADVADQENSCSQPQVNQEYFQPNISKSAYQADTTKTLNFEQNINRPMAQSNKNKNINKTDTVQNEVFQKSIKRLQQLKETNPTDKDMDVIATANKLYKQFGSDTYKVILTSATAPYALNNFTKFNIRPTTHEMIKYLSNNNLTTIQRAELDAFVAGHIAQMKFTMQNQLQNQR